MKISSRNEVDNSALQYLLISQAGGRKEISGWKPQMLNQVNGTWNPVDENAFLQV